TTRRQQHHPVGMVLPDCAVYRLSLAMFLAVIVAVVSGCGSTASVKGDRMMMDESLPPVATFSIVAFDPRTGELGVAVQSKFIAVGAVVPWARAEVGAVATQAWANTTYGPRGIELLSEGVSPNDAITKLTEADPRSNVRQLGIISAKGEAATFTGDKCNAWAGGRTGKNYAVQGNILAGEKVVDAMAKAFEEGKGDLGERMIAALAAGQEAGGDTRGKQSAAMLIVRKSWGYSGFNDRYRDLRVDDHPDPINELLRIYRLHQKVFPPPKAE
ncbi:MAG: DUF1028 domain-containing protein, partial [Phycisphaeraceae bacterium]